MLNRVVITGVGCITPIGNSYEEFKNSLYNGTKGFSLLEKHNVNVGQINFDVDKEFSYSDIAITDRFSRLAWLAYLNAKSDSKNSKIEGLYHGVGFGGAFAFENSYTDLAEKGRVRPTALITSMVNNAANFIASKDGVDGATFTYCNACASSSIAIGEAYKAIAYGDAVVLAAGGTEACLTNLTIAHWKSMKALSDKSEPFSSERKGIVLSEGSCIFILEELSRAQERGAKIYGEIVGFGYSCGAESMTKPNQQGQVKAIENALRNIDKKRITYINAHGTGTPVGDMIELNSIVQVFGQDTKTIPVSSTKALHGHPLGAAGAFEMVSCLSVLETNKVVPTWFLDLPDTEVPKDIWLPTEVIEKKQDLCLNNSFAFGGTNAVLALGKFE